MKKPERLEKELSGSPGQRKLVLAPAVRDDVDYWTLSIMLDGATIVQWWYRSGNAARVNYDTWSDYWQPEGWDSVVWMPK